MRERPILFSAPMARAILDGSKTQTRRIVKPQPEQIDGPVIEWCHPRSGCIAAETISELVQFCPYGAPGDRLWVRETWRENAQAGIDYRADTGSYGPADGSADAESVHWRPSIFMPRAASRISLEITGVRVERVQDISEDDARAEGVAPYVWTENGRAGATMPATEVFAELWDKINGKRAPWESNPWVWVVEFKRALAR